MGPVPCPRLVGRDAELDVLTAGLDDGGVLLVTGEAGIGKSRLVAELARRATARGLLVAHGRASPETLLTPYRPFSEALMSACRRGGPPLDDSLVPFRAALGQLLPEWRVPTPSTGSPVVLAEGVLRLLLAVGRADGVLLVLEDAHWWDPESLSVLEHLADHARGSSVRCVVTLRPGPGPAVRRLQALIARRAVREVRLDPLGEDDVATMARACLQTDRLPPGLELVLARADGLPYLVEELLAGGAVTRAPDGWRVPEHTPWLVPESLADAVAGKLAELAPAERTAVRAAALLGAVDVPLLSGLLGVPEAEAEQAVARCVDRQLFVLDPETGYRFRHSLTRDAVLAQLGPESRAVLARRVHDAVLAAHPGLEDRWCAVAAALCRFAGDDVAAARLTARDARRALAAGALTTAGELIDAALPLAAPDPALTAELADLRLELAVAAGDADAALATGSELLTRTTDDRFRARVALRMAEAAVAAGRWADARDHLASVRERSPDAELEARLDAVTAEALIGQGRLAEAGDAASRVLERASGEPACQALEVLGRIARTTDLAEAEARFTDQLRVATELRLPLWRVRALHELGTIGLMRGVEVARLQEAREEAVRAGAVATTAVIDLQLAGAAWLAWDVDGCLAAARRCQEAARLLGLDLPLAEARLSEAGAHCIAGDRPAMETALDAVRDADLREPELEAGVRSRYGLFALLREDRDRATAEYDAATTLSRTAATAYRRPFWQVWALLRTLGDGDGRVAREEIRPTTQLDGVFGAWLLCADAVAAGRAGRTADAERLVARAHRVLSTPGTRAQRALLDRLVAEAALDDVWGEPVDWLTSAARFFRGTGHVHLERACRSLLRRAGAPLPRGTGVLPPPLAEHGLTGREADVLALVADGLTSAEVGRRLYISSRTVDKHVERILAKTGLLRRADLRRLRT